MLGMCLASLGSREKDHGHARAHPQMLARGGNDNLPCHEATALDRFGDPKPAERVEALRERLGESLGHVLHDHHRQGEPRRAEDACTPGATVSQRDADPSPTSNSLVMPCMKCGFPSPLSGMKQIRA